MISKAGRIFLLFVIIISSGLKAQSFIPKYNFKHLNVQNGLTQNIVYHFLQDSRGYMWIGTHNGLTLFDGIRTTSFLHNEQDKKSISGNFINSILEDSAQQVWVGNDNGIDLYNRPDNSFSHFAVDRPDGTKENTYCVLLGFISANELWFLDTKTRSISSLNIKTKSTLFIAELNAVHAFFYKGFFQSVHIWSSYDRGTIHQVYRNNKLVEQQTYFSGKNDPLNYPAWEVSHVFQQNDTAVWLSTNEGLVKLNPVLNKYRIFKNWQNKIVRELRYAALSPGGQLWLASGPAGVYTFDINTNQFIANYRNDKLDPFSICSDNIVSLYFDKTGNAWCGSYGNGCSYSKIEDVFFTSHLSKTEMQAWQGNNGIEWLDYDTHDNLWCMFENVQGFWVLDKELKIKMYRNPLLEDGKHFNNGMTKLVFGSDNTIWCATNKGLYTYDLRTNRMRPVKYKLISEEVQGSIWIKDMIRLNDGSMLFSTFVGLYHLRHESGKTVVTLINFLKPGEYNGFGHLFQDKENFIYVKTLGELLYILKPTHEGKEFDLVKTIHLAPGINQYLCEKGDPIIYLATTDGLYHINSKNFQVKKERISDRLPFVNVSGVFKKDNTFWIFGEKGLYLFEEKDSTGRLYTIEDGLPANDFSQSALIYSNDGKCIAGTSNGLVSFSPQQKQNSTYPPRPRLTNIYINDALYTPGQNPDETQKINLSYRENTFSFDFSPISFLHAAECTFEYKLEGYDETWVRSGSVHYTRYSKIPPGNYIFNLQVRDVTGRVSPFTKTLEIQIAKAFWQTTLFKIAVLIIILLIVWLLLKWYFSYKIQKQRLEFEKQQAIERERTRIATDMHDDLGAGLSRIKFLSQALINKKNEEESIKNGLEKITGYSDEMTEKMGEIVWALNEKNDTLADLVAYTRSYVMEYLANHNIQCEANTPLHLPGTFIPGEIRRTIFLAVKECLHNIVKHANADCVYFSVELNEKIEIIIHDNGKGIDWNNQRPYSNGLQNIRKRMNEIKGKAEFLNEKGTKVLLDVPLSL